MILVYCILRNEAVILPYFLRHYGQFADKIIIYDDHSNDGSRETVAGDQIAELRALPWEGIDDRLSLELWSECNKEAAAMGANWAICVDADEFIYHEGLKSVLNGTSEDAIKPEGWQMLSDTLPTGNGQIYDEVKSGARDDAYDKTVIFRPGCDIAWGAGRHHQVGRCSVKNDTGVKLLHFHYFGEAYARARAAEKFARLSQNNKSNGWGVHADPGWQGNQSVEWYRNLMEQRRLVIGA